MPTKPSWHADATRLHDDGLAIPEIARRVGRTQSAVWKALNPERSAAQNRLYNADPARKDAKREWDRAQAPAKRAERARRYDHDPEIPGLLPIWNNKRQIIDFTRVDYADWLQLRHLRFSLTAGYARATVDDRNVYLHHLLLGHVKRGSGMNTDHLNRDKLDNRRANLRVVSTSENQANRGGRFERCWARQLAA